MTAPELVLTPSEMKQADLEAIAGGVPGFELMRRAGRAVADAAEKLVSPGARIVVVAGPGQNGGDGFIAAALLAGRGYRVSLGFLGSLDRLTGDAAEAAKEWTGGAVAICPPGSTVPPAVCGASPSKPLGR